MEPAFVGELGGLGKLTWPDVGKYAHQDTIESIAGILTDILTDVLTDDRAMCMVRGAMELAKERYTCD